MTVGLSGAASRRLPAPGLRPSTIGYAALAAALVAAWPAAQSLGSFWSEILDYEHGWLVAAISICWLVLRRTRLDSEVASPSAWGSIALLVALLVWMLAYRSSNNMASQLMLPAILWLAVAAAAGLPVARQATAPLAYLYFAIPVWDYLLPSLQRMTVAVSELGLSLMGIQAHVLGDRVTIPEGTFEVAEGCSGKRYLVVALALAGLLGAVNRLPRKRQLLLFATAAGLALLANWIRVIVIIYAGHISAMRHYLVTVEHQTFGLEVFAVLIVAIAGLGRHWAAATPAPEAPAPQPNRAQLLGPRLWAPFILLGMFALLLPMLPGVRPPGPVRLTGVPVLTGRWSGPLPAGPSWHPYFPGASEATRVAYASGTDRVEVYVNVYGEQVSGSKPDYYENSILTPYEWEGVESPAAWRSLVNPFGSSPLRLVARSHSGELWEIAYGYAIDGRVSGSALFAQLYYGALTVAGPAGSGVVGVAARCEGGCDRAHRLVTDFWTRYSAALAATIPTHPGSQRIDR